MAATFTLKGSGSGAVKAVQDFQKALKAAEGEAEGTAKATSKVERMAQRLADKADPMRKYNREMQELGRWVAQDARNIETAELAAKQLGTQLERAGNRGRFAFGAEALGNLRSMITGYVSMAAAVSAATRAFQELADERRRVEEGSRQAVGGEGSLAQLAATQGSTYSQRKAALDRLTAESRGYFASGAFASRDEAGAATFRLNSAGLSAADRRFAVQVKRAGVLQDVGSAAEAYSAISKSLGSQEVGSFEQFLSKALQASALAPAQANEIPLAASRAAGSGRSLGLSDEFIVGATALLAGATGQASEGGTQLSAFLKQVEKSGQFQGKSGLEIVEAIAALPEAQQGFGGVLGDRAEAVQGFRTLKANLPQLRQAVAAIDSSQRTGLAAESVRLGLSDPNRLAAILEQETKNTAELQQLDEATTSLLFNAARNESRAVRRDRAAQGDALDRAAVEGDLVIESIQTQIETGFGLFGNQGFKRRASQEILDRGDVQNRELADALRANTEAVERSNRRLSTRQE